MKNIDCEQKNHKIYKTPVIYNVFSENHGSRTPPWGSSLGLIRGFNNTWRRVRRSSHGVLDANS